MREMGHPPKGGCFPHIDSCRGRFAGIGSIGSFQLIVSSRASANTEPLNFMTAAISGGPFRNVNPRREQQRVDTIFDGATAHGVLESELGGQNVATTGMGGRAK